MSEVDDFLSGTMPRLMQAEEAIHNGDVAPRLAMWSRNDPVTLFGAWMSDAGWDGREPNVPRLGVALFRLRVVVSVGGGCGG